MIQLLGRKGAAGMTVATDFETGDYDMELALALNLALETFEEIAFKFLNFAAAEAGHVQVIAVGTTLIVVFFSLQMHEIELVDQAMTFEQAEGAIDGDAVDTGIEFAGFAKKLAGIEVGFGGLDDLEDGATLTGHAEAARH